MPNRSAELQANFVHRSQEPLPVTLIIRRPHPQSNGLVRLAKACDATPCPVGPSTIPELQPLPVGLLSSVVLTRTILEDLKAFRADGVVLISPHGHVVRSLAVCFGQDPSAIDRCIGGTCT